jgi:hypothetical protein
MLTPPPVLSDCAAAVAAVVLCRKFQKLKQTHLLASGLLYRKPPTSKVDFAAALDYIATVQGAQRTRTKDQALAHVQAYDSKFADSVAAAAAAAPASADGDAAAAGGDKPGGGPVPTKTERLLVKRARKIIKALA